MTETQSQVLMRFPADIWNIIKSYMLPNIKTHLDRVFENRLRAYLKTAPSLKKLKTAYHKLLPHYATKDDKLDKYLNYKQLTSDNGYYSIERGIINNIIKNSKISIENRTNIVINTICELSSKIIYDSLTTKINIYIFNNITFDISPFLVLFKINDILLINNMKCIVVNISYKYVEISQFNYNAFINKNYEIVNNKIVFTTNVRRLIWTYPNTHTIRFYNYFDNIKLFPTDNRYYTINNPIYTSGEEMRLNNGYGKYVC